jgi:hypothetical protein
MLRQSCIGDKHLCLSRAVLGCRIQRHQSCFLANWQIRPPKREDVLAYAPTLGCAAEALVLSYGASFRSTRLRLPVSTGQSRHSPSLGTVMNGGSRMGEGLSLVVPPAPCDCKP